MSKEKSEKKEKKEKKREKLGEDGVTKKEKKDKKRKSVDAAAVGALNAIETATPGSVAVDADGDVVIDTSSATVAIPKAALVPFAHPLADDKNGKKVLKTVKKAAKAKALKRGVKEVVKAVRKTPPGDPSTPASSLPSGIVVLAADISPMDVISHIPVLCEDHNIPYVFLPSRAELGAAGSTKRPTSVVMVTPKGGVKKGDEVKEGEVQEWGETYADLNKLVLKMGQYVKV